CIGATSIRLGSFGGGLSALFGAGTHRPLAGVNPGSQKHWAVLRLPGIATASGLEFGGQRCWADAICVAANRTAAVQKPVLRKTIAFFLRHPPDLTRKTGPLPTKPNPDT